jgi:hypothetical protein
MNRHLKGDVAHPMIPIYSLKDDFARLEIKADYHFVNYDYKFQETQI